MNDSMFGEDLLRATDLTLLWTHPNVCKKLPSQFK
jgi:hypothetical protein